MDKVSAIIPAYNEENRIGPTVQAVRQYVDEVIVVDDGSRDGTVQAAEQAGARVIRQAHNQGYIAAIQRGFQEASYPIVVTIDADGEFPADKISELVEPIRRGEADMVQGRRNFVPRPSEKVLTWLAQRKAPVGDSGTGFRALRTSLARQLALKGACICGIFSLEVVYAGGHIREIPVTLQQVHKPRKVAWFHVRQFFYLLPFLFKKAPKEQNK